MSDHGHAATSEGHADHHDEYLGVPADEPGPGEPSTPGWVTLLGMGLVLVVMLGFVVSRPDGKTRAELAPAGSAAPQAAAAPTPAPNPAPNPEVARPARPPLDMFRPGGNASAGANARPVPSGQPRPARPGPFAVGPGGSAAAPVIRPLPPNNAR